ncbi:gliding motility-associated ABC transporter substrate-binding protein GldG [Flavobacterium cyanobacteriorum]|uniref:Gliding motility-associated ABC transporter substrate-binding protein GldG n=1 Tax=Flavobacterium cyanobacteriorum TaxID=2022802 RepID=A0A255Z7U0_9FLAO|nr:gliding motility-associated ABC transporter substrate-binding protein GldG [Flavobacterium cyanobacteriorum]OYQ37538.1 gliding motility-associated ABC transporter substrate-binding protein GldG [Flavobacterium cyanobacteriorum]
METRKQKNLRQLVITIAALLTINFAGNYIFKRFDLTHDKRYTLSETSLKIIKNVDEPLYIDVFLEGEFPGEFKRLQDETRQLLQEFEAYNPNVKFTFFNPMDESEGAVETKRNLIYTIFRIDNKVRSTKEETEIKNSISSINDIDKAIFDSFTGSGMKPASIMVNDRGKQTEALVFPWAIATYKGKSVKIPLLKNMLGASTAEKVVSSVQHLEYAFADAFNKVTKEKQKKVAVIRGNGELHDILMADFIKQVRESYYIGPFTLDSVAKNPIATLKALQKYDLAIIAKPTERFTEEEKQVLDQFIINGGKTLWMIDAVQIEMDSLYNESGATLAFPRDLNLSDMFFKYGFRINPDLIKDEQATPIKLATGGQGSGTQYQQYFWKYSPFIYPETDNPIVKNMSGIRFEFANPIDTLRNSVKKTILLKSSQYSKKVGTPVTVQLDMVAEKTSPQEYKDKGLIPVSVLLEGRFRSMYENRLLPFKDPAYKTEEKEGKMIVVADGDVVKNQLDKNYRPLELGYDKWTNNMFDNREFLMNCVNYLLDDTGLINIRSKEVDLPMLDKEKVYADYTIVQFITVGLPIVILAVSGFLFTYLRRRKYGR